MQAVLASIGVEMWKTVHSPPQLVLTSMARDHPQGPLLQKSIAALASPDFPTAHAAAEALATLLGPGKELDEESGMEADRLALSRIISALVEEGQKGAAVRKRDSSGEAAESGWSRGVSSYLFHAIVQVAAAIAVRSPTSVGAAHPPVCTFPVQGLPFTETDRQREREREREGGGGGGRERERERERERGKEIASLPAVVTL
jgi:hypothetical protein